MEYSPEEVMQALHALSPLSAMELRAICAEQKVAKLEKELEVTNHLLDEALIEDEERESSCHGAPSLADVSSLPTLVPDDIS